MIKEWGPLRFLLFYRIEKDDEELINNIMNAAVMNKPLSIELKKVKRPSPGPNEALIKVKCIGICGSDIHYFEHGKIGRYIVDKPIILGHEVAGEIVEIGENVKNVFVGDRVAIEPGVTCGRCEYCKTGRYNLCPDVFFLATPPDDGAWADYLVMRSDVLFKLPDNMSYEEGAMLEPLSVGYHAMNRAQVKPSDRVLILGMGPIGLLAIQAAKLFGVKEIYACDVVPFRLESALKMGATAVFNPMEVNVDEQLKIWTKGEGINVVIESSGNRNSISNAVLYARQGGRVVFIGLPPENQVTLDINRIIDSELNIYGVMRYANTYSDSIKSYAGSGLDTRDIITHNFALNQINEALEVVRRQKDIAIKVMIYPDPADVPS
ncbi:NAD(P)-dependent alcohol dehydrogenase [Paenibacillus alkaliterrae]|uniref:NAD(P)-dependent alcohol dehydrogenase n=1 Tax=Paenibacillus alkaliterrae TaxID=320909 RepID=UPI001F2D5C8E|nr:NAD(P)-dependent alcohol dehydrogenase [Paenibacillus alkaliterrae]MCF2941629.1 NAD(P)-dependent alcohol dehydrogenase [Paenibacillus alkaliterrae]